MTIPRRRRQATPPPEQLTQLAEFRYRLRRFLQFSESAAESAGISAQQYQLLQVIAAVPDQESSSISYIAERMLLRHNSAVELVDRATRSGLVRRVADERDLRRSVVEITDHGAQLLTKLVEMHLDEIEQVGPELIAALEPLVAVSTAGDRGSSIR